MTKKKILIISYHFPPNKSVGSRRWAKFSKHLQRKGHEVVVLCAASPKNATSNWDKDIEGLEIHTLPQKYPKIIQGQPKNVFEKIQYKVWLNFLKLTTKGTVYDQTIFWEKQLLKKASLLIREREIDTVITNGPPFRLVYYSSKLKELFPHLKLLSDFRDPWTWWYNMGYAELEGEDKELEAKMERAVVENSDAVLAPNEVIQEILQKKYTACEKQIHVVPHAFDQDEFALMPIAAKKENKTLRMVYFGTLYNGLSQEYEMLAEALKSSKEQIEIDIYTNLFDYKDIFEANGLSTKVNYQKTIPMQDLVKKIPSYDYVIIVSPDFGKDNISTKFYEIVNMRIPFFFISKSGKASEFITKNDLGIHCHAAELKERIQDLVSGKNNFVYNKAFNVSQFSFDEQTDQLLKLIDTL